MDFKEMFDSENVDLFEESCNLTPTDKMNMAGALELHIKKLEDKMERKKVPGTQNFEKLTLDNKIDRYNAMQFAKSKSVKFYEELTDTNTDVGMQALSEKLSTLTDNMGYTEEGREMFIETAKIKAVISNLYHALHRDERCDQIAGSKAEGTAARASPADTDTLMINPLVRIYNASQNPETTMPFLRMVEDITTPAGYIKLQLFDNGIAVHKNLKHIYKSRFIHKLINDNDMVFLSNEPTKKYSNHLKHLGYEKHGPAATIENSKIGCFEDHVYSYICESLPDQIMPWFKGKRRYDWPNEETMNLFKQMGCVIVAIGHQNSPEQKLQWRLSFTKQELYLMHNLNMTQYRCYVILKNFKSDFIKYNCDSISSYHLKTVLFYTIENSNSGIWQPKYLSYVVLKCLYNLGKCVAKMDCPNYFIPQENMFETKLNHEEKEKLISFLSTQFHRKFELRFLAHFVSKIQCKGDLLRSCSYTIAQELNARFFHFSSCVEMHEYPMNRLIIEKNILCLENFTEDNESPLCPRLSEYTTAFPEKLILVYFARKAMTCDNERLQQFLDEMPTNENIYPILIKDRAVRRACCHVKKFFYAQWVSIVLMGCRREQTHINPDGISDIQNQLAGTAHFLNSKLKQASILYINGHHELAEDSLNDAVKIKLDLPDISTCFHSTEWSRQTRKTGSPFFMKRNLEVLQKLETHQMTVDYLTDVVLTCLHFDFKEMLTAPANLQFEAFRTFGGPPYPRDMSSYMDLRYIVIDPIIFLHYLRYKNYEAMADNPGKNRVLRSLEKLIFYNERENKVSHFHTTLNCLGHIYVTKGWHRLAISCFRKSMNEDSLYNASKWHIMCLLFG